MLGAIRERTGGLDLSMLETAPRERRSTFSSRCRASGRKTTACVLLFSYDRPELPVDTHVYRVSSRLELIRPEGPLPGGTRRHAQRAVPPERSTSCTST